MHDSIDQITQRTQRYWYVDGLAEMAGGGILLLLGLFFAVVRWIPNVQFRSVLLAFGQPVLILAGVYGAGKLVAHLKERITYPRTGYVAYKRNRGGRRALAFIAAAAVTAIVVVMVALTQNFLGENWLPIISATLVALFTLYLAYQFGLKRFYVLSGFTFLLGLATAWLAVSDELSSTFFFSTLGCMWILSGAWTLRQYLVKTSPLIEGEPCDQS